MPVHERLDRITTRSERDPAAMFNNLFSLLNSELLFYAFRKLKRDKAPGVDGVTVVDYEEDLQGNLQDLEDRLHRDSYRPQPSLRREIPKGNGKTRPLGIATVEDKIVQRAIVTVLERIYEVDFCDTSYGFRPKRSCHQALADLGQIISRRRVNWVLDADIKGFFDHVDFGKLLELLGRRVEDPRMLQLITRFLHAGVMIQDERHDTTSGASARSGSITTAGKRVFALRAGRVVRATGEASPLRRSTNRSLCGRLHLHVRARIGREAFCESVGPTSWSVFVRVS